MESTPCLVLAAFHLEPMREEGDMPEHQPVTEMPVRLGN
jgi:hypothetical protein